MAEPPRTTRQRSDELRASVSDFAALTGGRIITNCCSRPALVTCCWDCTAPRCWTSRPRVSALDVVDRATRVDPALRLTASSEADAEPRSETDALPAWVMWAAIDWDGALTDQPLWAGAIPETRGAVPRPSGPGPS